MMVLIHQRAGCLDLTFYNSIQSDSFELKVDSSRPNSRDFHQIVNEASQLSHLTINHGASLILELVVLLLKTQQLHGVGNRGQRVAEFMTDYRQELVLAAMQVDQRLGFLLRLFFQLAAFGDVSNLALNDFVMIFPVSAANHFDLDPQQPLAGFQWQMFVSNVSIVLVCSDSCFVGRFFVGQADLPEFLAQEMLV